MRAHAHTLDVCINSLKILAGRRRRLQKTVALSGYFHVWRWWQLQHTRSHLGFISASSRCWTLSSVAALVWFGLLGRGRNHRRGRKVVVDVVCNVHYNLWCRRLRARAWAFENYTHTLVPTFRKKYTPSHVISCIALRDTF